MSHLIIDRRYLSEVSSGEEDFGFEDPWVITAFVLLGLLLFAVFVRAFTKYCCSISINTHAFKQKIGLVAVERV